MAVLQKTRIEGLLTAEAGITLSGGVLTAPSGTINNLTSNTIKVNTSVNVGSNTTLTSDSISTDTANFTTIEADTYRNLPVASETLQGISYLTDNYLAGQTGRAVSAVAVYNFYQNITGQMDELEDRVIGVSSDAFNKNPPTLWSVKNYADQMSITGGDILDDVADSADMYVEKPAGSPTLNIHIKKFVTQTEFEVLNDLVEELTGGDTGIITDLGDRVSKLESALPISSFGSTTVYNYIATSINNRLGWSDNTTVQSKITNLETNLTQSIESVSSKTNQLEEKIDNDVASLTSNIGAVSDRVDALNSNVNNLSTRVDEAYLWISRIPSSMRRFKATRLSDSQTGGKITIKISELGISSLEDARNYIYIVSLNGFILRGPEWFPGAAGSTDPLDGSEFIFYRGSETTDSYVQTVNSLLPNQELMVFAFGYNVSDFNGSSSTTYSTSNIAQTSTVKAASKILW